MAPRPPAEATGLVALMLLHDSRRAARLDEAGNLVLLEEQDRGRWDQQQIAEALPLVEEALRAEPGPFALQAAIAAVHCRAARAEDTNWPEIVRLYDLLGRVQPSPVVALNRAVAIAMADGPQVALASRRSAHRHRRSRWLSLAACRACRSTAPHRIRGRSSQELCASPGTGHQRQRTKVSRATAARTTIAANVS